ncbi:MAG: TIGR04282 family arsenosugar biosynthesis glycosyltransferase [Gemmatimonadota bacterium]
MTPEPEASPAARGPAAVAGRLAVVVFAKAPVPGRVKTRLARHIGAAEAAALQAALLGDTLEVVLHAARRHAPRPALWCAAAQPDDADHLGPSLPPPFRILPQGSGGLGERLERVFERLLATHSGVLALGSDCPDLTPGLVRDALRALARRGAALGEARDGGYWCLGLSRVQPDVFRDIPWSTPEVALRTRERLAEAGIQAATLPVLRDLDVLEDLLDWARRPVPAFRRTRAWCRSRGLTAGSREGSTAAADVPAERPRPPQGR